MPETLLSPSNVLLYGRIMLDLKIVFQPPPDGPVDDKTPPPDQCDETKRLEPPPPPPRLGQNNFLQEQLADPNARLARIYGFSYEGHYYDLASPAIFLVHGEGSDPEAFRPALNLPFARTARATSDADRTGVAGQSGSFSEDMRVWSYDQGDFTIRMDVESGPFVEMLLEVELAMDEMGASYSGAKVRGAKVRGAKVRGAKVRGAKVRGAKVRGDLDD